MTVFCWSSILVENNNCFQDSILQITSSISEHSHGKVTMKGNDQLFFVSLFLFEGRLCIPLLKKRKNDDIVSLLQTCPRQKDPSYTPNIFPPATLV
jgi:hypothetical protein